MTVLSDLPKYKLDSVGVQVRWEGGGTEPAREYTCLYGKGNENHELGTGFFVHKRSISAVKMVEFVSDRMSYIILRGRWCHVIVLNRPPNSFIFLQISFYSNRKTVNILTFCTNHNI
jgi:hypothetical protein